MILKVRLLQAGGDEVIFKGVGFRYVYILPGSGCIGQIITVLMFSSVSVFGVGLPAHR